MLELLLIKNLRQYLTAYFVEIIRFQYTVPVTKFDRHGYKPRDRYLVLTNASVYVLDAKDCKVKHCLSFNTISGVSITQGNDNLILVRIPGDSKKDKGDLILECHFLIECLTWMIHATGNNKIVHIEETPSLVAFISIILYA